LEENEMSHENIYMVVGMYDGNATYEFVRGATSRREAFIIADEGGFKPLYVFTPGELDNANTSADPSADIFICRFSKN
jgi:hypothetical protein